MAVVRVNLFFNCLTYTWSETYFCEADTLGAVIADARVEGLINTRLPLSPATVFFNYARISLEGVFRDSRLIRNALGARPGTYQQQGLRRALNDPYQALLCRVEAGALHRRQLYLRGVPDEIFRGDDDQVYFPNAAWLLAFATFTNFLAGVRPAAPIWFVRTVPSTPGALWTSEAPTVDGPQNAPMLTLNFPGGTRPAGAAVGGRMRISLGRGAKGLNKVWTIQAVNPSLITIDNTIITRQSNSPLLGTPQTQVLCGVIQPNTALITRVVALRGVKRATGGSIGLPRGRKRLPNLR